MTKVEILLIVLGAVWLYTMIGLFVASLFGGVDDMSPPAVAFWPILLALVVLIAPLVGAMFFGDWIHEKTGMR